MPDGEPGIFSEKFTGKFFGLNFTFQEDIFLISQKQSD